MLPESEARKQDGIYEAQGAPVASKGSMNNRHQQQRQKLKQQQKQLRHHRDNNQSWRMSKFLSLCKE